MPFGSLWPSLGSPLAFLGLPGCSGLNLGSIFRANVAQVPRLRTKSSLPEFSRGSRFVFFTKKHVFRNESLSGLPQSSPRPSQSSPRVSQGLSLSPGLPGADLGRVKCSQVPRLRTTFEGQLFGFLFGVTPGRGQVLSTTAPAHQIQQIGIHPCCPPCPRKRCQEPPPQSPDPISTRAGGQDDVS